MNFPEIPNSYIIAFLVLALIAMRSFGIDTFTETALGLLIGYVTGKHIEQTKHKV